MDSGTIVGLVEEVGERFSRAAPVSRFPERLAISTRPRVGRVATRTSASEAGGGARRPDLFEVMSSDTRRRHRPSGALKLPAPRFPSSSSPVHDPRMIRQTGPSASCPVERAEVLSSTRCKRR